MGVRPLVVTPTDVEPHAVGIDVSNRMVEGLDVEMSQTFILCVGLTLEHHVTTKPEVGRVELQDKSRVDNGLVLGLHGVSQCVEILLVVPVVSVGLEQCDHAGRRGVHKCIDGLVLVNGCSKVDGVLVAGLHVLDRYRTDTLRTGVGRRAADRGLPFHKRRVRL